jgi:flagellar basal body-associated protein FliL
MRQEEKTITQPAKGWEIHKYYTNYANIATNLNLQKKQIYLLKKISYEVSQPLWETNC